MLLSWNDIRGLGCLLLLLLVSMAPHGADAQESKVSINDLVNETQKQSNDPNTMNMIWWIPEEYWVAVAADDPSFTEDEVQEILEVLRPYTLIAVADGKMGPFGGITWTSEVDIRNNISLIGTDGIRYNPMSARNINPDARNLMSMLKPLMASWLGEMGENIHFFLFPSMGEQGQSIASANENGNLRIVLKEQEYRWKLPLSSLFPPLSCPKCGEKCSGVWEYCPWCGTKLIKTKTQA